MAKTNTELPRDYRERQKGKPSEKRISTGVAETTDHYIDLLAAHAGKTRRQIIEDVIGTAAVEEIIKDMTEDEKIRFLSPNGKIMQ